MRDYVSKGTQLFIQGKLQARSWDDKDSGQKRYRTEILAFDVTLLNRKGGNGRSSDLNGQNESGRRTRDSANREHELNAQFGDEELDRSEIPF